MRDVVFTPADLPCKYRINVVANETGGMTKQFVYKDGGLFAIYTQQSKETTFEVVRADLKDYSGVPIFVAKGTNSESCQMVSYPEEAVEEIIEHALTLFITKETFDGVRDDVFQGQKCKAYYKVVEEVEGIIYADEDNYIIGVVVKQGSTIDQYAAITYDFDFSMDEFVPDRSIFPDCDQKAYDTPKEQC